MSPMSTPLRSTSKALCRVAIETVDPATRTGSITANGRHPPGATDVDLDVDQTRADDLRRVLVGDGPARCPRRLAQLLLQRDVVDLDDDAVDLVLDVVSMLAVVADEVEDARGIRVDACAGADGQSEVGQHVRSPSLCRSMVMPSTAPIP